MAKRITEKIVDFLVATDRERIPGEAISVARNAIIDCLGVIIAGSGEPPVKITAEHARTAGSADEAGIICHGFRTSADSAAWVNGVAAHVLDYDDTVSIAVSYNMHPTVPILPAVLALGEKCNATGSDLLTAYICGIEVEYSLGSVIGQRTSEMGWHPTPVLGTLGAAAASARILKLNAPQIQMALGIACSLTGGFTRNFGTMTKSLHAGNAARAGVLAALLAKNGFTAEPGLIEGKYGFYDMFSGGQVSESATNRIGDSWEIASRGITFKPYPCCRGTHPGIDAILYLRKKYNIHAGQVASITCKTRAGIERILRYERPKTGLEAKFSMQHCVAAALIRGKVSLEDFTNEKVNEAAVQELITRVSILHPGEWEKEHLLAQEVAVKLKDGTEYVRKVTTPKGEPGNPMTDEELQAKFTDCAHMYLSRKKIKQVLDILTNLEYVDHISGLMELLTYNTEK